MMRRFEGGLLGSLVLAGALVAAGCASTGDAADEDLDEEGLGEIQGGVQDGDDNSEGKGTFVSGNSTLSDCGLEGSDAALLLTGDLEGCLSIFIRGSECNELEVFDLYLERGREVFVGELHGKPGIFRTSYTFEGAYAPGFCQSFAGSLEVGGGCIHRIDGKSGVFKHAEGLFTFIDVITNVTGDPVTGEFMAGAGANNFLYYGRIDLDDDD